MRQCSSKCRTSLDRNSKNCVKLLKQVLTDGKIRARKHFLRRKSIVWQPKIDPTLFVMRFLMKLAQIKENREICYKSDSSTYRASLSDSYQSWHSGWSPKMINIVLSFTLIDKWVYLCEVRLSMFRGRSQAVLRALLDRNAERQVTDIYVICSHLTFVTCITCCPTAVLIWLHSEIGLPEDLTVDESILIGSINMKVCTVCNVWKGTCSTKAGIQELLVVTAPQIWPLEKTPAKWKFWKPSNN